jgi:monoamine oxidase
MTKKFTKSDGQKVYGAEACYAAALEPFKAALARDSNTGWDLLMKYDGFSTRTFFLHVIGYPAVVIEWIEIWHGGTGAFRGGIVQVRVANVVQTNLRSFAVTQEVIYSLNRDYPSGYRRPLRDLNHGSACSSQDGTKTEETKWWCLEGGSEILTDAMHATLKTKPLYSHRVTSIAPSKTGARPQTMKITVAGHPEVSDREYSHVVSTVPLPCLRMINLTDCGLDYQQKTAVRALEYSSAVKVGIKFKTRWWQHDTRFTTQTGGASLTDRPSRMVVYPSYGLREPADSPGVLIVAYAWLVFQSFCV